MIKRRIPDWILEDHYSGEKPAALPPSIIHDDDIQKRIAALKKADRDFLDKFPPDEWAAVIMRRYRNEVLRQSGSTRSRPPGLRWAVYVIPSFIVIFTVLVAVFHFRPDNPGMRAKGREPQILSQPVMNVYRKRGETIEKLEHGFHAQPGDLLQIAYSAPEGSYGVILSLDGRGVATLHFPADPESSTLLGENNENFLPASFQLDDAPEFERFFFITSKQSIDVDSIYAKVVLLGSDPEKARHDDLELNETCSQTSLLILKGEDR